MAWMTIVNNNPPPAAVISTRTSPSFIAHRLSGVNDRLQPYRVVVEKFGADLIGAAPIVRVADGMRELTLARLA